MTRLCRVGLPGAERLAMEDGAGQLRDVSKLLDGSAHDWLVALGDGQLESLDVSACPVIAADVRRGPCIATPSKFIGIGLNYRDHAKEVGLPIPDEPAVFLKAPSCLCGPDDDVLVPHGSVSLDWEVEIAAVISRRGRYLAPQQVGRHLAGYCLTIDFSDRDFQLKRAGQWTKGKSADTFGPVGPWLVSPASLERSWPLGLWLTVDGETQQQGSTADMVFDVAQCVSYVSQFMTLEPGDIITTGTPSGVAMGRQPPRYLRGGSVVECGITHLGSQRHVVRAFPVAGATERT